MDRGSGRRTRCRSRLEPLDDVDVERRPRTSSPASLPTGRSAARTRAAPRSPPRASCRSATSRATRARRRRPSCRWPRSTTVEAGWLAPGGSRGEGSAGLPKDPNELRQRRRRRDRPRRARRRAPRRRSPRPRRPSRGRGRAPAGSRRTRRRPARARRPSRRGRAARRRGGRLVRAPVTPTSETQYRNPPDRSAIIAAALRRRRRGDEVDDGEPASAATASNGAPSSGVRSATMIPAAPASASRARGLAAVAAADHLVRVAHGHERDAGARFGDPSDELDRAVEGRAGLERRRRRALERRAVGERVGVRQPDLEHVRAARRCTRARPRSSCRGPGSPRRRTARAPRDRSRARRVERRADPVRRRPSRLVSVARVRPPSTLGPRPLPPLARTTPGPCRRGRRTRAGRARPPGTARRSPPCRQGGAAARRSRGPSRARAGCPRSRP